MTEDQLLQHTILDAKERKVEWLKRIPACAESDIDTIFALTEALCLVELRAQQLYLKGLRKDGV